ncbi:putative zinc-binding protein [Chloroflexota bacterium]
MIEDCGCNVEDIILLPCSGGSNCGQIANRVAVSLDVLGIGRIYCLAGIGAHIDGMVESARGAKRIVALDGCSVACAKKVVEHAGLKLTDWICVTEQGVEKKHNFFIEEEDVERITERARELLNKPALV